MKIEAYQIPPEYQESPLAWEVYNNIVICGNRDYIDYKTELFENVEKALENIYDITEEAIMDYIPPKRKSRYSTEEISEIKNIIEDYVNCRNCDKDDYLCDLLSIVDERKWEHRTIRGVVQSDWQKVYYPVEEWTQKDIDNFEIEYFNIGTEWNIVSAEEEFSMYCHSAEPKEEIAFACGVKPEDVVLYVFDGYVKTPKYKII